MQISTLIIGKCFEHDLPRSPKSSKAYKQTDKLTNLEGPTFFTAGIYIILGQMISQVGPHSSPISATSYLWIFCTCDLISLVIQAVGGGLASSSLPLGDTKPGTDIMVAGIVFQMAAITVFVGFFAEFLRRTCWGKVGPWGDQKRRGTMGNLGRRAAWLVATTAVSVLMIYIRSVYRTIELLQGWEGYLITRENYFIVLDGVLMIIAVGAFNVVHPAWFLHIQDPELERFGRGGAAGCSCNLVHPALRSRGDDKEAVAGAMVLANLPTKPPSSFYSSSPSISMDFISYNDESLMSPLWYPYTIENLNSESHIGRAI
jgi:RTA1 like protein